MGTDMSNASLEWDRVERIRRNQRRRVARLKEKQRLAETNKWSARNSTSVKKQVEVRQALREWFEALRGDSEGVHGAQLVDAVITLGLNHDYKQVQRTVAAEADTVEGLLLSPKRFTAALLRCCASDLERERLFRSLRGEGEWRRCGGDGEGRSIERRKSGHQPDAMNAMAESVAAAGVPVPAFITQLSAYRRRVLMATVADRFPTPCTASFWTPDSEGQQHQLEAVSSNLSEASSTTNTTTPAVVGATGGDGRGFGLGGEVDSAGSSSAYPETTAARGGPTNAPPVSVETRKRYDAVSEAVFLAKERGQLKSFALAPATPSDSPSSANSLTGLDSRSSSRKARTTSGDEAAPTVTKETRPSTVGRRPRTSPARKGSVSGQATSYPSAAKNIRRSASRENGRRPGRRARTTSSSERSSKDRSSAPLEQHSLLDTAARLRDSLHRKELRTATVGARWDNYRVMKKRWRRRTPIGILTDDELDEADRSYSRLSRPRTNQGTKSRRYHSAECGSAASSSACRRPSTAPVGQYLSPPLVARGSSSFTTYDSTYLTAGGGNSSDINRGGANGSGRRPPWEEKPLPLGPIPLNEGKKLRYPLLQLKRERARAGSARGTRSVGDGAKDRGLNSARQGSYVDAPVTTNSNGRWQPHLAKVPCRIDSE